MMYLRSLTVFLSIVQVWKLVNAMLSSRDGAFVGYSEKVTAGAVKESIVNLSCFDEHEECEEWTARNECINNPVYMQSNCRQSCGFCEPYIMKSPYYDKHLLMITPLGEIKLTLLWDRAPETCHLIAELAEHHQLNPQCNFYRNEAVPQSTAPPEASVQDGSTGPPYGLLQGVCAQLADAPKKEQTTQIKAGHVATIHPGKDFYVALMDHEDWSLGHTVWAAIDDLTVVNKIVQQPFNEHQHVQYGTHMRMMAEPVHFTLQLITV